MVSPADSPFPPPWNSRFSQRSARTVFAVHRLRWNSRPTSGLHVNDLSGFQQITLATTGGLL
jgi:hypothetical protein